MFDFDEFDISDIIPEVSSDSISTDRKTHEMNASDVKGAGVHFTPKSYNSRMCIDCNERNHIKDNVRCSQCKRKFYYHSKSKLSKSEREKAEKRSKSKMILSAQDQISQAWEAMASRCRIVKEMLAYLEHADRQTGEVLESIRFIVSELPNQIFMEFEDFYNVLVNLARSDIDLPPDLAVWSILLPALRSSWSKVPCTIESTRKILDQIGEFTRKIPSDTNELSLKLSLLVTV